MCLGKVLNDSVYLHVLPGAEFNKRKEVGRSSQKPRVNRETRLSLSMILAALLTLVFYSNVTNASSVAMVTFQRDGAASNNTYLRYLGDLPDLEQVTVCFRMHLLQARQEILVVSYSQADNDNELYVGFDYDKQVLMLTCCATKWEIDIKAQVYLRYWTSICAVIDLVGLSTEVVQDGDIIGGGSIPRTPKIRGGGHLYIGQEQDTHGGGFNELQSFRGSLADLRLYGTVLSTSVLKAYTLCKEPNITATPILDFGDLDATFEISEADIDKVDFNCTQKKAVDIVFPEPRHFNEGELLCRAFGGKMKVPTDKYDNNNLYDMSAPHSEMCGAGAVDTLWLGVKGNATHDFWFDVTTKKKVSFSNFENNRGRSIREPEICVAFKGRKDIVKSTYGIWMPKKCDLQRCVPCYFPKLPFVRIRGLCRKSEFDRQYFLVGTNGSVKFVGTFYSAIIKHPQRNNSSTADFGYWTMSRFDKPSTKATLRMKSPAHYPTGLNAWEVEEDVCGEKEVKLRMTSCKDQEFSCNDGTCIPLPQRCNMEANCKDGSDEVDCNFLVLPEDYDNKTPPPRQDPSSPVNISLHITMFSVRAFDLTGFNFVCEIEVRLCWNDTRLRFHHLNEDDFLNTIHVQEDQKPWMPSIEYLGDAYTTSDIHERRSFLIARRMTNPLPDDDQRLWEDEIFEGRDNPLVLLKKLTVTTSCQFDLITFPFDTQTCRLAIVLSGVTKNYISLVPDGNGVSFLGNRKLLEYYLAKEEMVQHDESNYSGQAVELTFRNLSTFYVTSTYVPTFIIVIIGYLVFFFPVDDFNERIMVALTALLVEAAFFTQMSSSIPQTAYLKLVDIWFVYCIISLFLVVVTVAFINWFKKCAPGWIVRVGKYNAGSEDRLNSRRTAMATKCNIMCRLVCPILTAMFFVVYLTMAALIDIPKLPVDIQALQFL